jgi:thioredoxin reductase (NADPH)
MSSYLVRAIESTGSIAVRLRTEVVDGGGEPLEWIKVVNRATDVIERMRADALFVMIGGEPNTRWLPDEVARDTHGYVITGRDLLETDPTQWVYDREPLTLETSVPGVFAVGDVRFRSIKRVASAVGEGATVVRIAQEHLRAEAGEPALR